MTDAAAGGVQGAAPARGAALEASIIFVIVALDQLTKYVVRAEIPVHGSVPVVRATGGLADTVRDGETGFSFTPFTADAFWMALQRALLVYNTDPTAWARLRHNGMASNFSWAVL